MNKSSGDNHRASTDIRKRISILMMLGVKGSQVQEYPHTWQLSMY
ncbi:MAG: hypothetical protein ACQ5SW_07195 [Sphaerochaetaceae bacterium]